MTDRELNLDAAVLMLEAVVEDLVDMVGAYPPDEFASITPILARLRGAGVTATALWVTANSFAAEAKR